MYTGDKFCHSSTIEVMAPVDIAFDYLSDAIAQSDWALGSLERHKIGENLFTGKSLFNDAELFISIDADRDRLIVFYHVGTEIDNMQPRNVVRIVPGAVVGKGDDCCLVTLLSWRSAAADDDKWKLTCVSHETEMFIIKDRIEKRAAS